MEQRNETWVSCTFSQTGLDGSSDLMQEVYADLSFVQCIALAMALDWVYLVILGATRGCTLYEINAYAVGEVIRDPNGGDSRCKTPDRIVGCRNNDTSYPVGYAETKTTCQWTRQNICTDGESAPFPPPLTSCTSPFQLVPSVGCIFVDMNCWLRREDNEPVCRQLGGRMASPKTVANFMELAAYLITEYGGLFHAGADYNATVGDWVWRYHGRTVDPSEWYQAPTSSDGRMELTSWYHYKATHTEDVSFCNVLCMADL